MSDLFRIENTDEFCMRQVYLVASRSKDPRTWIGAVLLDRQSNDLISTGWNGFARKVYDLSERYSDRELKLEMVVHAETNSILNAARKGVSTFNTVLYTQTPVCSSCSKHIIQAGISEIVYHRQALNLMDTAKWAESQKLANTMLDEAGIKIRIFDKALGIKTLVNGKVVNV